MDKFQAPTKPMFIVYQFHENSGKSVPVWSTRSEAKAKKYIQKMSLLAPNSIFS